jgi:AcrR family transcriptional regulator
MKDALVVIMKDKPFEKITVYEICKTAGINRSTFYKHYGSQSDVLADIENDLFAALERHMLSSGCDLDNLVKVTQFLSSESEKWRSLINAVPSDEIISKIFTAKIVRTLMANHAWKLRSARQEEYALLFFCTGGYGILRKWLNEGTVDSPEEIALLIIELMGKVLKTD